MLHIEIRGVDHYYEWIVRNPCNPTLEEASTAILRSGSSGKPVLVFLHGWGGSARYWQSTAEVLSDTFDCLLYDMRGFGRSLLPKQPTITELTYELETYAVDLKELLDALNLPRVYLNAHSTGASIATLFLNLYPERVERAILTCSGVFEYDEQAFSQFHKFGGFVVKFRPRWLAKIPFSNQIFMARFLHRPLPDAVSQAFLEDFLLADYQAALGTMLTAVSKQAAEVMPHEYARISVPTLLIAGEYDRIIPVEMGRRAAELNQKIQFVEIPNTAHFPMLEDPDTYLEHVREFLQPLVATEVQPG